MSKPRRIDSTLPAPTPGQRLAMIIAKHTGVLVDSDLACPNVKGAVLEFAATVDQAADIVRVMTKVHGVAGVRSEINSADADDIFAVVYIPMSALA